jgi:acetyltransferase-like isoleucine patch superfamily enzyme
MPREINPYRSHGDGAFERSQFRRIGGHVIFEAGVMVWHPETIILGENVYVGHGAMLKGYYNSTMEIGDNTWIGQQVFIHSGGGVRIGNCVGIGPAVKILTSAHAEEGVEIPILFSRIETAPVIIEDDCDLGVGSIILPGVTVGRGTQVGAGAVVTKSVPPYSVVAGVPAKVLRSRLDDPRA